MKAKKVKDLELRKKYLKYELKRSLMKHLLLQKSNKNPTTGANILSDVWKYRMIQLQKLPTNSIKGRLRNRCIITNRSRSVNRLLKISRHEVRKLALAGHLPGIKRSTW